MSADAPRTTFDDLLERYGEFYRPRFKVGVGEFERGRFVDRKSFATGSGPISDLTVDTALDRTNRVSFSLTEIYDAANRDFDKGVTSTFAEGNAVQVWTGYGTGDAFELLFRGAIDEVRPTFPADGAPTLSVSAYDLLHELADGTGSGEWPDATLADVVNDLTADLPFAERTVGGTDVPFSRRRHTESSDYAFLERLAEENGFELFSRAGELHFREPATNGRPEVRLTYGRALRSFTPSGAEGRPRVGTVTVRHVDEVRKREIVGTADVPGGGDETHVESTPVRSREEAERRAASIARRIGKRSWNRGETFGLPEIQIGRTVELSGLGSAYDGRYYVTSATHRVGSSGYTTDFEVRRADDGS